MEIDLTKTEKLDFHNGQSAQNINKTQCFYKRRKRSKNIFLCDDAFDDGAGATDDSGDDNTPCRLELVTISSGLDYTEYDSMTDDR